MNKTLVGLLFAGVLALGCSGPASGEVISVQMNLGLGMIKTSPIDSLVCAYGAGVDIRVSRYVVFSPEVQYWTEDFFSFGGKKKDELVLGAMMNFGKDAFFLGVGRIWLPFGELTGVKALFKINVGYKIKHIRISLYLLSNLGWGQSSPDWFGGSIGYIF